MTIAGHDECGHSFDVHFGIGAMALTDLSVTQSGLLFFMAGLNYGAMLRDINPDYAKAILDIMPLAVREEMAENIVRLTDLIRATDPKPLRENAQRAMEADRARS